MKNATLIFLQWWNVLAHLYQKHGASHQVQSQSEWAVAILLQEQWLEMLQKQTGSDPRFLFTKTQDAIAQVLDLDTPIVMTLELAEEILRTAIDIALMEEMLEAQSAGRIN